MVAAAAEAASVLFTLGYNNIIFVSLYNFSSRNVQGVLFLSITCQWYSDLYDITVLKKNWNWYLIRRLIVKICKAILSIS